MASNANNIAVSPLSFFYAQNTQKFHLTSKNETRIPIVDNKIHQTASEKKLAFSASLKRF